MPLYVLLLLTLAFSGVFMGALVLAFRSPRSKPLRIREEKGRKLNGRAFYARTMLNALFSGAMVFGFAYGLYPHLFYEATPPWWRVPLEAVGVLLVYDFVYYLMHRFPFHRWSALKRVHAVHHKAKHPTALDSLYLHPVENVLGLALLTACTWAIGPVHVYSYAAAFFVYSQLNIAVHCGLDLPLLGSMSRKHDKHHASMRAGNYASLTPLPDLLFGTLE
jgi:sterol desaturase/sphingolipid hydroxylase (fatty acid hydroxylase superfamily)